MTHETSQIEARTASLVLRFAAGDLFIQAIVDIPGSMDSAKQFIAAGPKIIIERDWLYLRHPTGELSELCQDYEGSDECGRWIDRVDRSLDTFLDSLLTVPEFLQHEPVANDFVLEWFSIAEWSWDQDSNKWRLVASTSGYIDRTVQDSRPSSKCLLGPGMQDFDVA